MKAIHTIMISYFLTVLVICILFFNFLEANMINVASSLQQKGTKCLNVFHGKKILETLPQMGPGVTTPWLLAEGHVIPEAIKNIMGIYSFCLTLVVAGTDKEALTESHAILKHFPLSILVILADDVNIKSYLDYKDDTIILPREKKRGLLLCPGKTPKLFNLNGIQHGEFLCPRKLKDQEIKISYIDYEPYYYIQENPAEPTGIIIEAMRILSSKKQAHVEFIFNQEWSSFNPETGEWHLGCVSMYQKKYIP